jgi:phosphoribosylamine--glycine ligase
MKILLIDAIASYVDFAMRCEAAGHEVRVFMGPDPKGQRHPAGDGLVTKVPDWQSSMKWADLICTSDNTKYVKELEGYRNAGFPIFGCNVDAATWELQRDVGVEVFERCGIKTIPSILFKNYDEAIAHLDANPLTRYVSKPLGDADRALSYVSKSSRDLRFMLTEWKKHAPRHPFIFQEFHGGIEVAVGAWVGRNGFGKWCLENFEHKKLMNEDIILVKWVL